MELLSVFELMFTAQGPSEWTHWPFGPTIVGSWLNMLTKFIFIGLILALMMYMLRYLFGPGGPMREEPEMSEEQKADLAMELLRKRMEEGRIDTVEFERIKQLLRP
ncbi:hypothetical protein [Desulfonatronum parangueonense]